MIKRLIQIQLEFPGRYFGRFVLPRLWNRRNKILNDITLDTLEIQSKDKVLEVGFGGGYLLKRMLREVGDGIIVGVDISRVMTAHLQKRLQKQILSNPVEIICASAEKLPFQSESYSKICSINSVFYWNNVKNGLSEIHRVLQKKGQFVITFTSDVCLKKRFHMADLQLFNTDSMKKVLNDAGFQRIHCQTHQDKYRIFHCCVAYKNGI